MLLRQVVFVCRLLVLITVLAGLFTLPRLSVDNDILALFPDKDARSAEALADELRSAGYERQLLLLLGAPDMSQLGEQLPGVVKRLRQCDCLATVTEGAGAAVQLPVEALYQDYAPALLSDAWRERLQSEASETLRNQVLRELLTRPGAMSTARLTRDPLGSLADYTQALRPLAPGLSLDAEGRVRLQVEGQAYYLLSLELAGSPFAVGVQASVSRALDEALQPVRSLPGFRQLHTGVFFFTQAGTEQARGEISTVGLGSLIGVMVLLLLVFRSLPLLFLAFTPIAVGVLAGLTVTQWLFGEVHVMALVFGAALTGVAIDYSLHFFTKRMEAGPAWQAHTGSQRLLAPLGLGLLTSMAGYLSFTASGFPGFVQIAVLSSGGLLAAFATVLGFFPVLLRKPPASGMPRALEMILVALGRWQWRLVAVLRQPLAFLGLPLLVLGVVYQWQSNDDIRQMQTVNPELAAMDKSVREPLGGGQALQYLLVNGADTEALLQRLETLERPLDQAVGAGNLGGYRSLADWLPSQQRQRQNLILWRERVLDSGLLESLYRQLGMEESRAAEFAQRLGQVEPLSPEVALADIAGSPLAPVFFAHEERHYALVSLVVPVNERAIAAIARKADDVQWVDPVARTNHLLEHYRVRAAWLLALSYLMIALLVSVRYGARGACQIIAPPALASTLALAGVLVLGQGVSVFHMMALLLVLGIGVDYTLFLREGGRSSRATLLAIVLSTITTVLSFGLLALSATTAIHNFGLTVFLGIVLAFLLAPLATARQ